MWDERYSSDEYAYGREPNSFLAEHASSIPLGKVLCLAEGEGRNAVFLAKRGYSVTAVDSSVIGLEKAKRLAQENGVVIEIVHADLAEYALGEETWHGIVSIFCPLPSRIRKAMYSGLAQSLVADGIFILEAYRPEQIGRGTGGGDNIDVMQNAASLRAELPELNFEFLSEVERNVKEGIYHTGIGAVVQAVGRKIQVAEF